MKLILVAVMLWCTTAFGAPFIVSDEWPSTASQPTYCFIIVDGKPSRSSIVGKNLTTGGVYCYIDLAIETTGAHTSLVNGCIGSDSTKVCGGDVAFNFTKPAPVLTAPVNVKGLRVVP